MPPYRVAWWHEGGVRPEAETRWTRRERGQCRTQEGVVCGLKRGLAPGPAEGGPCGTGCGPVLRPRVFLDT